VAGGGGNGLKRGERGATGGGAGAGEGPDDFRSDVPERDVAPEETPRARVRPLEWSPWLWVLPLAALVFVGWLVVRWGFLGGGHVTVRFVEARGLDRYSPVRFRGAKVGTVQKITVDESLGEVVVRLALDREMREALRTGTRFWIVEPGLEGGVASLLSGTYVGIAPGTGEPADEFRGQEHAPVLAAPEPGKIFLLESEGLGEGTIGAPVKFRGIRVGRVLGAEYDDQRGVSVIHLFVVDRYAPWVREGTRFWRTGGLSLSLAGGRVGLGDASLAALLSPGFAFYTPEMFAGPPAPEGTRFELLESQAAAIASAGGPHLEYLTYFPGSVSGLAVGTPVEMKGVPVGHVRDVRLRYVPSSASLETPVTLEIDPRSIGLDVPAVGSREELRQRTDEAIGALVRKGLRAVLSSSLVLPGAGSVRLDLVAPAGTARLDLGSDPPVIPAAAGGDGLAGAMESLQRVAARIEELPLREIAGDLRSAARRVDTLVGDPRLDASLGRLDSAMTRLDRVAGVADQNVEPIAESLRNAAATLESAATQAEAVVGTAGANVEPIAESLRRAAASAETAAARAAELVGTGPRQNYDLSELVKELTRAAESVRALATYLSEHPDAVLKGRAP
jgi:paraquat-inducible protein B